MSVELVHPVDEALADFKLIGGAGAEANKEACAMTLLAWMRGRDWTDKPECAHPTICDLVIRANDAPETMKTQRAKLVKLGVEGVLDTWWVPSEVIAYHVGLASKEKKGTYSRAVRVLECIAEWKQERERPDFSSADLRSADLSSVDLSSANLRSANLSSADLSFANLSFANLSSVDLSSANLSSADLSFANLSFADLRSADLSSVDLSSANLSSANLSFANLSFANLSSADLSSANLSSARGNQYTVLPNGWKVNDSGLIVPTKESK